jgi:cobalt-zinc-cadmium efflux system outer membrane protein
MGKCSQIFAKPTRREEDAGGQGVRMVKPTTSMLVILVLGIAVSSVFGVAQPPAEPNAPQTLEEYLRYAALQNAALKAAFEDWKAALEQIPQAKALPDPRFTYGYFIEEVETRVGPQRQRLSLTQMFPWFGTIAARTDAAAAAAQAAYLRYEAKKLSLFNEVKNAFYEYVYLASAIDIAEENLVLLRHFEEVARAKYIAATAQHPDVIRAQVAVAKLEDRLKSLQELRGPIVARLNAALNRPTEAVLPWPKRPETHAVQLTPEVLFAALKRRNPQLGAKEYELHGAQSRIELAKKKFYPEIGLGLDWIDTGEARMSGVPDSGKDPVIAMLTLNLPIWRQSYRAGELQARAMARRTQHEKTDLENTLLAQTERALYDYDDNGRKLSLYGDVLVPKAEELVGASETAYTAGTVDFLSLIDAEQTLLQFQLERERAWANRQQMLSQLEMLVGADLTRPDAQPVSP